MKITYMVNPKLTNKKKQTSEIELTGITLNSENINESAIASKTLSTRLLLILINTDEKYFISILHDLIDQLSALCIIEPKILQEKQNNFTINNYKQQLLTMIHRLEQHTKKNALSSITTELNLFTITLYQAFKELNRSEYFQKISMTINNVKSKYSYFSQLKSKINILFKKIKNKCLKIKKCGIS